MNPKWQQTFKPLLKNHPVKTKEQEILICKKNDFCHLLKPQKLQLQAPPLFPVKKKKKTPLGINLTFPSSCFQNYWFNKVY